MTTTASELQTKGQAAAEPPACWRALPPTSRTAPSTPSPTACSPALTTSSRPTPSTSPPRSKHGLAPALIDRLKLNRDKLAAIASDTRDVAMLPDPVGEMIDMRTLPNGMQVGRKRVPLGVIAAIYESRPNVTVDIASLCLKAGSAAFLRGGKETINSNKMLAAVIRDAIESAGAPADAVQLIEDTDRGLVGELLKMKDVIDLVVPRGGVELIRYVTENAEMPVLTGGTGVCHTYVDAAADIDKAVRIAHNAKTRRYTICNALDTLLVHADIAERYLPQIARAWAESGVEIHCDARSLEIIQRAGVSGNIVPAAPDDFGREFWANAAAIKVVDSLDEAMDHIYEYGTGHSDAIVTEDYSAAMRFLDEVDTAVVYVNASTQFTDGAQFGLGAEIIDSTQKTIARGPVGLREITTYKWIVFGNGHIRPK